jgi:hypothetical protein
MNAFSSAVDKPFGAYPEEKNEPSYNYRLESRVDRQTPLRVDDSWTAYS